VSFKVILAAAQTASYRPSVHSPFVQEETIGILYYFSHIILRMLQTCLLLFFPRTK